MDCFECVHFDFCFPFLLLFRLSCIRVKFVRKSCVDVISFLSSILFSNRPHFMCSPRRFLSFRFPSVEFVTVCLSTLLISLTANCRMKLWFSSFHWTSWAECEFLLVLYTRINRCSCSCWMHSRTADRSRRAALDLEINSVFCICRRSSIGTFIRPHSSEGSNSKPAKPVPPKLDYRSMVSIDDMPELFVSFDSKWSLSTIFSFRITPAAGNLLSAVNISSIPTP